MWKFERCLVPREDLHKNVDRASHFYHVVQQASLCVATGKPDHSQLERYVEACAAALHQAKGRKSALFLGGSALLIRGMQGKARQFVKLAEHLHVYTTEKLPDNWHHAWSVLH